MQTEAPWILAWSSGSLSRYCKDNLHLRSCIGARIHPYVDASKSTLPCITLMCPLHAARVFITQVQDALERMFSQSHLHVCSVQRVHDWVASLEGVGDARDYDLASSFPRVVFTGAALGTSLAAHGLTPQAVLLVQPRDSGS